MNSIPVFCNGCKNLTQHPSLQAGSRWSAGVRRVCRQRQIERRSTLASLHQSPSRRIALLFVAHARDLKWYYDQKIISFFSFDFESLFAKHPTGKIFSFVFYPKAVYFECKFWISRSAITHAQNRPIGHQRVGSRENDVIYSLA